MVTTLTNVYGDFVMRYINELSPEDYNAIIEWIHHPAGQSAYVVDTKPDPDGKYPLSRKQIKDTTVELDKDSFVDLGIEPPTYKEPGISVKKNGIVKINSGLIRELMDAGGFVYFLGCGVVNKKYIVFMFLNSEGLIRHWEEEKEKPEDEKKIKVYHLKDHGEKIGELHLGKALRRAEHSPDTEINDYELLPDSNSYTSRDFGPDSLSFDKSGVEEHQLIKVILDPKKGESFNRSRGGKKEPAADHIGDALTPTQQKVIEKIKEEGWEEITPEMKDGKVSTDNPEEDKVEGEKQKQETPAALFPGARGV